MCKVSLALLLQNDNTTKIHKGLFELLSVFLRKALLKNLGNRFDELLGLRRNNTSVIVNRQVVYDTYVNERQVGNHSLDLPNNLGLSSSIERLKLDVEHCLFFGLLLFRYVMVCIWLL